MKFENNTSITLPEIRRLRINDVASDQDFQVQIVPAVFGRYQSIEK